MPRYAFVDKTGRIVIDGKSYLAARHFSEGFAAVHTRIDRWGYINKTGRVVITPTFYEAGDFKSGLARVRVREEGDYQGWAMIDTSGRVVRSKDGQKLYDYADNVAIYETEDEVGLIYLNGSEHVLFRKTELGFATRGEPKFSEGLLAVRDRQTGLCGFIDKAGKIVIPASFTNVGDFSQGVTRVSRSINNREVLFFVDHAGRRVIDRRVDVDHDFYRNSTDFSEGLASFIEGPPLMDGESRWLFIDLHGNEVFRTAFTSPFSFHEGLAPFYDHQLGKMGFFDTNGKSQIPALYVTADTFSDGLALVCLPERTK